MRKIEDMFENLLSKSRYLALVTVLASLVMSIGMFFVATVDTFSMVKRLALYATVPDDDAQFAMRQEIVAYLVKGIDGYLIALIVLVLGLGLYELFVSKIEPGDGAKSFRNVLQIKSLDDLKQRLARLILLILMVEFFRAAVEVRFTTPLDLLFLALGIALIGAAIYLSYSREGQHGIEKHSRSDPDRFARCSGAGSMLPTGRQQSYRKAGASVRRG